MSSNFLAPTASELEARLGHRAQRRVGDRRRRRRLRADRPPLRPRRRRAQREAVLARFGLIPPTAKTARSPGSTRQRPLRDRGDAHRRSRTRSRSASGASSRRSASTCRTTPKDRSAPSAGASAASTARRSASPASGTAGSTRTAATIISFAMLTINCDLHPLLAASTAASTTRASRPRSAPRCCSPRKTSTSGSTPRRARADLLRHLRQGRPRRRAGAVGDASRDATDAARHDDLRLLRSAARRSRALRLGVLQLGRFLGPEVVLGHPLALGQLDQPFGSRCRSSSASLEREAPDPFARVARPLARQPGRRGVRLVVEQRFELVGRASVTSRPLSRSHDERT